MESKAKFLGHPIHPILIVIPLGLFISSVIFDLIYLATRNSSFALVAFWNIAGGVLGGLLAAVFGLRDWLAIPEGTRAKSVGLWHGLGNGVVLVLFALSWWLRRGEADGVPANYVPAFVLSILGFGISGISGWLGGELVDRLGVGVDPGAHLNAPNSLTGKPASAQAEAGDGLREREVGH